MNQRASINRRWTHGARPLLWWLLLVAVLFGLRTHERLSEQTRLIFSVSLQEQSLYGASAKLDGKPFDSGDKISIGSHRLVISHPKTESFSTNFFIWYGRHDFGELKLKRGMGTLSIEANPAASKITVTGPEFSTTLFDSTGTNIIVPTDQYAVRAEYPHWSQSQNVMVVADTTAFGIFSPRLGALHLSCNRDGATYDLHSFNGESVDNGTMPATLSGLPTGDYQLTVSYHDRQLQKSIVVKTGATNDLPIQFTLGSAHLESVPVGATVQGADGSYLGQTPLDLPDMPPQTAQFNVSLWGYESASATLEITADQTNFWSTNLVSLRYLSAMKDARNYLAAANYDAVVQATAEALAAKPDDLDALALQAKANVHVKAEREREERLKRPREVFDALCARNPNAHLFAEHGLKTSEPAKEVEAAIIKLLQASPMGFQILLDDSPKPENYEVVAEQTFSLGILGGSQRDCLLVVGQTKDDETQVYFKVLEFQVQHTVVANSLFNFQDNKQLIPVHPSRMQMNDALQSQIQEGVRIVTERIQMAMNNSP